MPTTPITAPEATPPRLGLLASARIVVDGSDIEPGTDGDRWIEGVAWDTEDCGDYVTVDPCGSSYTQNPTSASDGGVYTPFVVEAAVECSTFGSASGIPTEFERRARRKLAAVRQEAIEEELWGGPLAQASSWSNAYLRASSGLTTPEGTAALGVITALAVLEEAIADGSSHHRGMIHATHATVTQWAAEGLLRREGTLILTVHDTIVVPGRGYDGKSPSGVAYSTDRAWAYASPLVSVRLGQVDVGLTQRVDDSLPAIVTSTNSVLVRAYQFAAATFDPCYRIGVLVDHTTARTTTGS